jgi:hypothetical protein
MIKDERQTQQHSADDERARETGETAFKGKPSSSTFWTLEGFGGAPIEPIFSGDWG